MVRRHRCTLRRSDDRTLVVLVHQRVHGLLEVECSELDLVPSYRLDFLALTWVDTVLVLSPRAHLL